MFLAEHQRCEASDCDAGGLKQGPVPQTQLTLAEAVDLIKGRLGLPQELRGKGAVDNASFVLDLPLHVPRGPPQPRTLITLNCGN